MPYEFRLQGYLHPADFVPPPDGWEARLREVSPSGTPMGWLRFRKLDSKPFDPETYAWTHQGPQWMLYRVTPREFLPADRIAQFAKHWSELPLREQVGRKAMVSSFQHFLFHTEGVEALPFGILQGPTCFTPASYTTRERRYLDACNALSDPYSPGTFPAAPFDERAIQSILTRDRFLQAGKRLDALEKMDRAPELKAQDDAAEREFRETFLDNWFEQCRPQAEFMQSFLRTADADRTFRHGTKAEADVMTDWEDQFIETGVVPNAGIPTSRKLLIPVG